MTASQSSCVKSSASLRRIVPALLTRMSIAPNFAMAESTIALTPVLSSRFASIHSARRPALRA